MGDDSAPNIDLNPHDWLEVRRILRAYVPEYEVWAFGSRAKWEAKPYSDLDLAILTDRPLSLHKVAELRSALDARNAGSSPTPIPDVSATAAM